MRQDVLNVYFRRFAVLLKTKINLHIFLETCQQIWPGESGDQFCNLVKFLVAGIILDFEISIAYLVTIYKFLAC